ncbi:unnamed protein product [Rotaria sp. Silwood1]|nr:unnamed protein product [Rotaria sp. Silwood1]
MSLPNKSLDKNKRYAGVKANDFVNKTRANETNRSTGMYLFQPKSHNFYVYFASVRPQGWANLGKINSRRIPPPANLPSLKSETGVNSPTFDPTITINHSWTSNENPTQQQIDSLPVNSPTLPPSSLLPQPLMDIDKPRLTSTWNTITSGTNINLNEQIPSLLPLNDYPRLSTTQDRKLQTESITNIQNPSLRPANIAIWKDGGSNNRIQQSLTNDLTQIISNNPGANLYQQQISNTNMRMYPQQMWTYNPYTPVPLSMHQQQQQMNTLHDYKSPTILRNKDIDDLSKLTDNTWANTTQEVNYEEKIRFSDDDDDNNKNDHIEILESNNNNNNKTRRLNTQILQHTRLIQDDKHLKQMQDNKNSELINTLNIAKQRRDEQERHLKNEQLIINNIDEKQKQIPGYQTRPLLTSNDQDNHNTWQTNKDLANTSRIRHDTTNSQSSSSSPFAMKSWSDQMDSFNYTSLHEKSRGHTENEEQSITNKYSRSQSETSSQSQHPNESIIRKSKKFPLTSKKQQQQQQQQQQKINLLQTKTQSKKLINNENLNYIENQINSNDQWNESNDNRYQHYTNDNRHHQQQQQLQSDSLSTQKINRYNNKQSSTKERQQTNSRMKTNSSLSNKSQIVWRPLSPNRPLESTDPTPQESISYKSQQRTNINEHKQRYQTTTPTTPTSSSIIDTASIPPLMSVRSDVTTTSNLYNTTNHNLSSSHYDDENIYYDSNLDMHQNYHHHHNHHSNIHNRRYTTLGSYGRYRRSGTVRHQQQYTTYNINNTSGVSTVPNTNSSIHQKKTSINRTNNKKSNQSSEQIKIDEISITKPIETSIVSSTSEILTTDIEKINDTSDQKNSIKNENIISQTENDSNKTNKKTTVVTSSSSSNVKRRTNKNQQNYHQDQHYQNQQAPRHRNNYTRSMQEYEAMQMASAHNYYGTTRRTAHNGRNTHMHDLSSGYYYEHPKQHYNNRYNYSNEHYPQQQQQQQQQQRSTNKNSKRGGSSTTNNRQQIINGSSSNNNNNNNFRHHSTSDNDQKEGEEWETASESSTNMRNGHYDTNTINTEQTNETKTIHRGRTPPKKSFSSQRPNARQIFKYTNA